MTLTCACGAEFDSIKELRVHIALETARWPVVRCTADHHDPLNRGDREALRWGTIAGTYRYVRLDEVEAYKAAGWHSVPALEGTRHGDWSTLMQYRGPERAHPMDPGHD